MSRSKETYIFLKLLKSILAAPKVKSYDVKKALTDIKRRKKGGFTVDVFE